jgi:hypothetical protein
MKGTTVFLVFALSFIGMVLSFSGTVPPTCNAYADFGCTMFRDKDGLDETTESGRGGSTWNGNNPEQYARNVTWEDELCYVVEPGGQYCPKSNNGDPNCKCRMNCIDAAPGIMPWAGRPQHAPSIYRLSLKNGGDSYTPGEAVILMLETLNIDFRFRGMVLYAVSGNADPNDNSTDVMNEQRVGSWEVTDDDIYFYVTPSDASEDCRNIIMHLAAAEKPYVNYFRFIAPPSGTGTITFRALIKQGNANTGNFYRPNSEDFSLKEGSEGDGLVYVRSDVGQSCSSACSKKADKKCNSGATNDVESEAAMEEVRKDVPCAYPSYALCDENSPAASSTTDDCYYRDTDSSCSAAETTCDAEFSGDLGRRICACGNSGFRLSGGNLGFLVALVSLFSLANGSKKTGVVFLVAFGLVFALLPQAQAHNWIFSDSRAEGSASVVFPCQPARSPKPNIQVAVTDQGRGQNGEQAFAIEWATGHGSFVYFALIDAEDAASLRKHSTTVFNNYLNEAIAADANNNIIDQASGKYHKQHRYYFGGCCGGAAGDIVDPGCTNDRSTSTAVGNSYVTGNAAFDQANPIVGHGCDTTTWGPNFVEKYDNCTTTDRGVYEQLRYTDTAVNTDINGDTQNGDKVVVGFDSAQYPWIKGVWKYEIEQGLSGGRMDVANFWIPSRYPIGKYIMHYFWNGYYDCVDVHQIANTNVQTASPCGERFPNDADYSRVDHCWFPDPEAFFGPVMKVVEGDFNPCVDRCLRHREASCQGVMFFPMYPPSPVPGALNDFFLEDYAKLSLTPEEWPRYKRANNQAFGRIPPLSVANQGRSPFCDGNPSVTGGDVCIYMDLHYDLYNLTARDRTYSASLRSQLETAYQNAYDAKSTDMWCAAVRPREKTNTKDVQLTTDDPRHPAFFSTCVSVSERVDFPLDGPDGAYPDSRLGGEEGPFAFQDQCVDCTNRRKNAYDIADPYWALADKCYNCDLVDAGINKSLEDLSPVHSTNMQLIAPNWRCQPADRWDSSNSGSDNFTTANFYPTMATCSPQPTPATWTNWDRCSILLGTWTMQGTPNTLRGVPGWTPSDATFDRNVCALLASQDDRCDPDAIWIHQSRRPQNPSFVGGGNGGSGIEAGYFTDYGCRCYVKDRTCCGDCSSNDENYKDSNNNADIFSLTVASALSGGNCTSATQGIYSALDNVCCHPDCAECTRTPTNSWTASGHFCDSDALANGLAEYGDDYLCSKVGAPCLVDA